MIAAALKLASRGLARGQASMIGVGFPLERVVAIVVGNRTMKIRTSALITALAFVFGLACAERHLATGVQEPSNSGPGGLPALTGGAPALTGRRPAPTGGTPALTGGRPAPTGGTPAVVVAESVPCGPMRCAQPATLLPAGMPIPIPMPMPMPMACCFDKAAGECGITTALPDCMKLAVPDTTCPSIDFSALAAFLPPGGTMGAGCCTADGQCGIDGSSFGNGCTENSEAAAMLSAMPLIGSLIIIPPPQPCGVGADGGTAAVRSATTRRKDA